ncbi:hypothetical protein ACFQJC_04475 [Haloferax namakaokahaiae]|uniref:Uncharacterized protein n=1 Tax=Haloferax namakaokahaiae TaxID=1748331 RepID=A0ABD5ZC22_9EURY
MVDALALFYVSAVSLLFFFWVYGIYAFSRDCRNTYAPKFRRTVRGWRLQRTEEEQQELNESERQLL